MKFDLIESSPQTFLEVTGKYHFDSFVSRRLGTEKFCNYVGVKDSSLKLLIHDVIKQKCYYTSGSDVELPVCRASGIVCCLLLSPTNCGNFVHGIIDIIQLYVSFPSHRKIISQQSWITKTIKKMRQLKGAKTKETSKEKRERKQENRKMKQKFWSVGLPVLLLITGIIVADSEDIQYQLPAKIINPSQTVLNHFRNIPLPNQAATEDCLKTK
uniref:Single-pass membrane and coiled-coil domain-containing protein 4 homolog n=1 Tax=Strigamia maritima TaxID=126957 RepID=T1IWG0_STRMM